MDNIDFRLVLLLLGVVVIAVIVWDGYRKKRKESDKAVEFNQEALDEMMDSRDQGGFDLNGVGLSRIIGDDDFIVMDEPLVASRDDDLVFADTDIDQIIIDDDTAIDDGSMIASQQQPDEETTSANAEPELIISISIIARSEDGFVGEKLLHCMLSRGLRFGDMNIFHRHKNTSGSGGVQFSLANAVKPGTFDLDDMSSFQTRGVTMFMMLPGPKQPLKSYKLMLDTAQHLASELNGQLVDSSRSALTQQTIQHFNEQIQDFERRNLSMK